MKNSKKGSFTVEATIVMPVIIMIIMILIRMCVTHYHNTIISSEAMRLASRTASHWNGMHSNAEKIFDNEASAETWINDTTFKEHDPYNVLLENANLGLEKVKKDNAEKYGKESMKSLPNVMGKEELVENVVVDRKAGLLQNYVLVTVSRKDINPLGNIYARFGLKEDEFKVTAKATQLDQAEFIRNISFVYDVIKENAE